VEYVWLFECEWRNVMKLEIISKYPTDEQRSTPLLFIHGTLHTARCWDVHFLDYFVQHGFAAHAVNLRGHGNSEGQEKLRWTRIAEFVEDVETTVRQLPSPPILIGHSMGGFILQKYLEDHDIPAAVLLSSPSPAGLLPTAIRTARRQPWAFAKVNLTLSLLPLIASPQLVGEAFFSRNLPEELLVEYWKQTQDDSYMAFLDMVALDLPKPEKLKTPLLVLGAGRDNMIGPHEIEATARAYHTQAEIIPDVAHNSMLEQGWQSVAERILAWLNELPVVADTIVQVAELADVTSL
jgi:pimeloyl-ACP methyl ester carboxylesterase